MSQTSDSASLQSRLQPLLRSSGGKWALTANGTAIERQFKFKNFTKTWDFMTAVSLQCKIRNHHPEWSNVYNTTFIRWTTHEPKGLSEKDVALAQICDGLAKDFGEVADAQQHQQVEEDDAMKGLADHVAASAGECCKPR